MFSFPRNFKKVGSKFSKELPSRLSEIGAVYAPYNCKGTLNVSSSEMKLLLCILIISVSVIYARPFEEAENSPNVIEPDKEEIDKFPEHIKSLPSISIFVPFASPKINATPSPNPHECIVLLIILM